MRINLYEETYFTGIRFSEFCKNGISPIAVTFCMRFKKAFTRLTRDLICAIQKFKIFNGNEFLKFRELAVYQNF